MQPTNPFLVKFASSIIADAVGNEPALVARSERGRLTPKELADYQSLGQEAQRIDAERAEALAELARRRGQVRAIPRS